MFADGFHNFNMASCWAIKYKCLSFFFELLWISFQKILTFFTAQYFPMYNLSLDTEKTVVKIFEKTKKLFTITQIVGIWFLGVSKNPNCEILPPRGSKIVGLLFIYNGVGIFYLHLILSSTDNSYSIHVKTVIIALEALQFKKNLGSSTRFRILP